MKKLRIFNFNVFQNSQSRTLILFSSKMKLTKSSQLLFFIIILNLGLVLADTNNSNPISLKLNWDDEDIENGKEFTIEITAFNLEEKDYDLRIYLFDDENKKEISESQNKEKEWISSRNYIKDLFLGPGEVSKNVKLRIKTIYSEFRGDAKIIARIREKGSSAYIKEIEEEIEVIENKNNKENIIENTPDYQRDQVIKEIEQKKDIEKIYIGKKSQDIKTNGNVVYESKNELIGKYSLFAFIILIIILAFFIIIRWKK